jgi:tRNA 2-thiouridine synthesizing protein A
MSNPSTRTVTAEVVVAAVESHWGATCGGCGTAMIGHDVVIGMLMGQSGAPRCTACLARALGDDLAVFQERARASVRRLGCHRAGWVHSDRRLARLPHWPEARWPAALRLDVLEDDLEDDLGDEPTNHSAGQEPALVPTERFDAGDMGCGDLVLELRTRLLALAAGDVLLVRATDPGAPGDLPAWCRVTHHTLLHHDHPHYWIRRRTDAPTSPATST